jgi:hypothetical protein
VKHPWSAPKHDYKLTGRLQLQITNMPLLMGPIRRTWADGKQQRIEDCIGDFMVGLTVAAAAIRKNRQENEERHRKWEEERKREEEERRIAEEQKRRAELVTELIENWEEATRLRRCQSHRERNCALGFLRSTEKRHSAGRRLDQGVRRLAGSAVRSSRGYRGVRSS